MRTRKIASLCCGALTAVLLAMPLHAQPQSETRSNDPGACAPGERLDRRDLRPDTKLAPGETLSDKLARTEGVLCPPPTGDPEIAKPPPEGGALKVIPPPGDDPGDRVQPK